MRNKIHIYLALSVLLNLAMITYKVITLTTRKAYIPATTSNTFKYFKRNEIYKTLFINQNDVVFIGDSQIQQFPLSEYFSNNNLKNRGIDGETSIAVYKRLNDVVKWKPKKIFIEIGANDIWLKIPADTSLLYFNKIINTIHDYSPNTSIYVLSVLPSNTVNNSIISNYNNMLSKLNGSKFIDLTNQFSENGHLNIKYDNGDGIHLSGTGYSLFAHILKAYI